MEINTSTFSLGHEKYCSYCGKKAIYYSRYYEYDKWEYWYCDCSSAIAQIELDKKQELLDLEKKKLLIVDQKAINKTKYGFELKKLKEKYTNQ
jgi:hypothetical protein